MIDCRDNCGIILFESKFQSLFHVFAGKRSITLQQVIPTCIISHRSQSRLVCTPGKAILSFLKHFGRLFSQHLIGVQIAQILINHPFYPQLFFVCFSKFFQRRKVIFHSLFMHIHPGLQTPFIHQSFRTLQTSVIVTDSLVQQ